MSVSENVASTKSVGKTVAYFAAFVTLGLTTAGLGPTLPALAENTGSSLAQIGYLFTASSLGYVFGSLLGGQIYDRVPGHPVLAGAVLASAVGMGLVPVMPSLWVLVAVIGVVGVAHGTLDVGANTLLVWTYREHVAPYMNGLHFCFGLGSLLAPLIVAQAVLWTGGITGAYWVLAVSVLPVAVLFLFLPSPPFKQTVEEEAATVSNYGLLVVAAAFLFLYVGAEVGFGGWIFTYVVTLDLANETIAAYLTSLFWGALTLGRLVAVPVANLLAPRWILLLDLAGCLLSGLVIWLGAGSLLLVAVGTFGLGLSMASIFPTTISLAERRMTLTGWAASWLFVGGSVGAMILPRLMGELIETQGPRWMMLVVVGSLSVAVVLYAVMVGAKKPQGRRQV